MWNTECNPAQGASFNALLQEDVIAEVMQHFSTRKKCKLATVCRDWRAWVATSWTSVELPGPRLVKSKGSSNGLCSTPIPTC